MKYMLLIHQGTTPTPPSEEWENLSEEEKGAVYAAYKAINEPPGVTSGQQMQPPETAATVRVQDGTTLTTDGPFAELKEAIGGYLFFEACTASTFGALARPPVHGPSARMSARVADNVWTPRDSPISAASRSRTRWSLMALVVSAASKDRTRPSQLTKVPAFSWWAATGRITSA